MRKSLKSSLRSGVVAVSVSGLALAGASSASAATLTAPNWGVSVNPSTLSSSSSQAPVVGTQAAIRVIGTPADAAATQQPAVGTHNAAGVAILKAGATTCPANFAAVKSDANVVASGVARHAANDKLSTYNDVVANYTFAAPGTHKTCGYYGWEIGSTTTIENTAAATTDSFSGTVNVEKPTVKIDKLGFRGALITKANVGLVGSLTSNAPGKYVVQLNSASVACKANSVLNAPNNKFSPATADVGNAYGSGSDKNRVTVPVSQGVTLPSKTGSYQLCVYAYSNDVNSPDLVQTIGKFTVKVPPVTCLLSPKKILMNNPITTVCFNTKKGYKVRVFWKKVGAKRWTGRKDLKLDNKGLAPIWTTNFPLTTYQYMVTYKGKSVGKGRFVVAFNKLAPKV